MEEIDSDERVGAVSPVPQPGRIGTGVVAVLAGLLTALAVGELLAWGLSSPGSVALLAVTAIAAAGTAWVVGRALRTVGREVRFDRSALGVVTTDPLGRQREALSVPYDKIDLVVRAELRRQGSTTAANYAVFHAGEDSPLTIAGVEDPQAFERAVESSVESPDEVAWHAEDDYGRRRGVESNRAFWRDWPDDEPIPRSAIIDQSKAPASVWTVPDEGFTAKHEARNYLAFWTLGQGP